MTTSSTRTLVAAAAIATLTLTLTAAPATARPDPGGATTQQLESDPSRCSLERVNRQLVRCDYLTGAGVAAPLSVRQQ